MSKTLNSPRNLLDARARIDLTDWLRANRESLAGVSFPQIGERASAALGCVITGSNAQALAKALEFHELGSRAVPAVAPAAGVPEVMDALRVIAYAVYRLSVAAGEKPSVDLMLLARAMPVPPVLVPVPVPPPAPTWARP